MVANSVPPSSGGDRDGKPARRRAVAGVQLQERDGYWHAYGSVRAGGRTIRLRKSLGIPASAGVREARAALEELVDEIKARASGGTGRGDPVAVAAEHYLTTQRERPLGPSAIRIVKEIAARFGVRRLNEIGDGWNTWVDGSRGASGFTAGRMTGRSAATRERFLNGLLAFLAFAKRHHGLAAPPVFDRDRKARNPNRRARRRVSELRPDLVWLLFEHAHIAIRAQLAVEKATGARASSVLYAARVCDLVIGRGRAHITFPKTKNGEDVTAALDPTTVGILRDYLKWRGKLHDREAPLFLTPRRKPYTFNGRAWGGQNKSGFNAAKRRAVVALREKAAGEAARLRKSGRTKAAQETIDRAAADAALLAQVTQHWFRHLMATNWLRHDPRATMEQGGWLDVRSVMGYAHDVPEYRQKLAAAADDLGTLVTRKAGRKPRSA